MEKITNGADKKVNSDKKNVVKDVTNSELLQVTSNLSSDEIDRLIEEGKGDYVIEKIENSKGLDLSIARTLLRNGFFLTVFHNIESFDKSTYYKIAELLVKGGKSFFNDVECWKKFGLDPEYFYYLVNLAIILGHSIDQWKDNLFSMGINPQFLSGATYRFSYFNSISKKLKDLGVREIDIEKVCKYNEKLKKKREPRIVRGGSFNYDNYGRISTGQNYDYYEGTSKEYE